MGRASHHRRRDLLLLFVHVIDTALVRVSPEIYNEVIATYKNPIVGLLEIGLVAAVAVSCPQRAANRARGLLVPGTSLASRMLYGVVGLWVLLMVPFTIRHLMHVFGE